MKRLPLFFKFSVVMIALSVVPVILISIQIYDINRRGLERLTFDLHTRIVSKVAEKIDWQFLDFENKIKFIKNLIFSDLTWDEKQTNLQNFINANPNIIFISLIDKNGFEQLKAYNPDLLKTPELVSYTQNPIYQEFKKIDRPYHIIESDGKIMRFFGFYPITKISSLAIQISLENIRNEILQERFGKEGIVFITDNYGNVLLHPDVSLYKKNISNIKIVQTAIKNLSETGLSFYNDKIGAFKRLKNIEAFIYTQQPVKEAYWEIFLMRTRTTIIILLVVIIAGIISYVMAITLTKPIRKIIFAADKVASGDFTYQVNVTTRDELRDLAETFNKMTRELKRYNDLQVEKIIEEKTKTDALLFSIADGIVMTDYSGKILLINKQAKKIFGIDKNLDEVLDKPVLEFIDNPGIKNSIEEVLKNPLEAQTKEVEVSSDNFTLFYQITKKDVFSPTLKKPIGTMTVLHDITIEKQLDKLKDDFLHSITHDLKNPITSIRGFIQFLLQGIAGSLNPQQKKMVESIDRASDRLLRMVLDILDLARIEAGRLELNLKNSNLKDIASKSIELLTPQAIQKNVKINFEVQPHLPDLICDEDMIERVFVNLIGNAIKFTPQNGTITVSIQKNTNDFLCMVADTGEGIPEEYLEKIFEKFQQVKGQKRGGTGVGLTICKYFVNLHNGRIWVESELKKGSRFYFTIPHQSDAGQKKG